LEQDVIPPILRAKAYRSPSAFAVEGLLREARRQKGIPEGSVPAFCVLDPDGDIVRALCAEGRAERDPYWACYHTELFRFEHDGLELGIVGTAVGASFAVLVAEQLFASGCKCLISITSAGQITPTGHPSPYFVVIEKALRDEGTSYHYVPPSDYASLQPRLLEALTHAFDGLSIPVHFGAAWTTDAPYRETEQAIEVARAEGILAVEMEAAALYSLAEARRYPIVCLAHVTNQMAAIEGDFEKGEAGGSQSALRMVTAAVRALGGSALDIGVGM
jgi:uridine phosphorylase